jgi:hypothetical protein
MEKMVARSAIDTFSTAADTAMASRLTTDPSSTSYAGKSVTA